MPRPSDYRELSLSTLDQLDQGMIRAMFDEQIRHALQDCDDRPNDKGKRIVLLRMEIQPVPDATGTRCMDIGLTCQINGSLPKQHSRPFQLPIRMSKDVRGRDRISAQFLPVEENASFEDVPTE